MKLENINITNFRCFESLQLDLERDVTVLVGINGAGKTTILDAIAVALFDVVVTNSGPTEGKRKKNGVGVKATDIFVEPGAGQVTERTRSMVKIGATAADLLQTPRTSIIAHSSGGSNIHWETKVGYRPPAGVVHYEDMPGTSHIAQYITSIWESFREPLTARNPLPVVAYYRAGRALKSMPAIGDLFAASFERKEAFVGALDAAADYGAMCRWLYITENEELRAPAVPASSRTAALVAMRRAIGIAIDGVKSFGFEGVPPRLVFKVRRGRTSESFELEQLSDGYRNLIGLYLDFARRLALANPYSEAPLGEPGILLIDEIELHLHPAWQQTVIPKLRTVFPNTQLIVTTHSPQVLTSVESRCIRILDGFKLHAAPSGTLGAESKRLLEDVLGVDSRPPADVAKPVQDLNKIYNLINDNKLDEAKARVRDLIETGYETDQAIIDAELTIENRLWEKAH